jgi:hypothetical protein
MNCLNCDFYDSNDFIHVIATQHVIASETKQSRINYECSGLLHSVRNDAVRNIIKNHINHSSEKSKIK